MEAEPREFTYGGSARIFSWYDVRDSDRFQCRCGWSGPIGEMVVEGYNELVDGSCPLCDQMLMIRSFPTLDEVRVAAARGDSGAISDLQHFEAKGQVEP